MGAQHEAGSSKGWESVAKGFIEYRAHSTIGAATVGAWAEHFPRGSTILDLGCGSGVPISKTLVDAGLIVYGVEASPTLAAEFHRTLPDSPIETESAQRSTFFGRTFDGIVAWGLVFLLSEADQRSLIRRASKALVPGGRLLFTAPAQVLTWPDQSTETTSVSLGADAYKALISAAGLTFVAEYDDEGDNHYYEARRDV